MGQTVNLLCDSRCEDQDSAGERLFGAPDRRRPLVVYVLTRLAGGGPREHVLGLLARMKRRGYATALIVGRCDPRHDVDLSSDLTGDESIYTIPEMSRSVNPWGDGVSLWRTYQLLMRLKPDIVHTHTAKAGLIGRLAARAAGVPCVVHSYHGNVLRGYFSRPISAVLRWCERRLAALTDCVCVLSREQLDEIAGTYGVARAEKVRVTPLGVEVHRFEGVLQPPECPFTVGWLGRMVPIKNIPLLVAAAEETLRRGAKVRFLVAGDGPERGLAIEAMSRLGRESFEWLGWQPDVRSMLARCHILIQTSRNEGTPTSLIQGGAAGRPFVSTPAGGVVDMVRGSVLRAEGGAKWYANGVLVEPDAAAIASVLCELAEQPDVVARMGRQAANFVRFHFDAEMHVATLDAVYREFLRDGRSLSEPIVRHNAHAESCIP
jgi:glycosyltransferase involved in cell wall biosynthesis